MLSSAPLGRNRGRRLPGYSWVEFEDYHTRAGDRLQAYQAHLRKNGVRLDEGVRAEISKGLAFELHAQNAEARLDYGWAALHHLQCYLAGSRRPARIGWLTLAFEDHAVSERDAGTFDPKEVQTRVRALLSDVSFLGCVEVAYYLNVGRVTEGNTRICSWHTHLLVWGCRVSKLKALVHDLNATCSSLLPGLEPAYLRIVEQEEALRQLLYMLRFAAQEYQAWPDRRTVVDRATGEITAVNSGAFRQRSRGARQGSLSRLAQMMSGLYVDELVFADGAGQPILDRINRDATAELRARWRAEQPRRADR